MSEGYNYKQMINFFELRLLEIVQKMEALKVINPVRFYQLREKQQRGDLARLYNLNLRLLKLWKSSDTRLEISTYVH
tara:strand:- start:5712 stop:5942 length:231 start_codon:yes stop_codon:yes gene_type:complete